jgi:hypothetical protein
LELSIENLLAAVVTVTFVAVLWRNEPTVTGVAKELVNAKFGERQVALHGAFDKADWPADGCTEPAGVDQFGVLRALGAVLF